MAKEGIIEAEGVVVDVLPNTRFIVELSNGHKLNACLLYTSPKLDKVVINVACGDAKDNSKVIDSVMNDLALISGQKPVVCRARKSAVSYTHLCIRLAIFRYGFG